MRSFFKNVFANIVAFMIIVAVFCLLLVMMIAASAFSDTKKVNVKDQSVLTLDFKTNIIDSPSEDNEDLFSFDTKQKNILIFARKLKIFALKTTALNLY